MIKLTETKTSLDRGNHEGTINSKRGKELSLPEISFVSILNSEIEKISGTKNSTVNIHNTTDGSV
jgi:hypothetical protein